MALTSFLDPNIHIRIFDTRGNDTNFGATSQTIVSLYDGNSHNYTTFEGTLFFPKVSVGLIESQQLYLLQEVTGPTSSFSLRSLPGTVDVIGGNSTITGNSTLFTDLEEGQEIQINNEIFTIVSIGGETSMDISPTPSTTLSSARIYDVDYLSYNSLVSFPGTTADQFCYPHNSITYGVGSVVEYEGNIYISTFYPNNDNVPDVSPFFWKLIGPANTYDYQRQHINAYFAGATQTQYFLYDITYDDVPLINKGYTASYDVNDAPAGSTVDSINGRIKISAPSAIPTTINLGFSDPLEYVYTQTLYLNNNISKELFLIDSPTAVDDGYMFLIEGINHDFFDITTFYFEGATVGSTTPFFSEELTVVEVGATAYSSGDLDTTYIIVSGFVPPAGTFSNYRIRWENSYRLANISLYGETEEEDIRFKTILENFGKKLDFDKEFIFRDSDINEELPDYTLLNKKRKELLLEGDNIYPFIGSYKALINVINFFGYNDLTVKEYFLNVDSKSPNYGSYLHVPITLPTPNSEQSVPNALWKIVPSTIYKKTSLFGLFYNINRETGDYDDDGIPVMENSFQFSPEEVLIKLFGLKELLKKHYLPANARIYDITGEGVYFELIRLTSWSDKLHHMVINLGSNPDFDITPKEQTYITDLRRLDGFYINKFTEQGLSGFVGVTASDPYLDALGYTGAVSTLFGTYVGSYGDYLAQIYYTDGTLRPPVDPAWLLMPPGISASDYNEIAARLFPLPDDQNIVAGGPVLLEAHLDISWEDSSFSWMDLSILGPTGSPMNINFWTWDTVGRGQYIDMRWVAIKNGHDGFYYDSGRKPISNFTVPQDDGSNRILHAISLPYTGDYEIGLYIYDITNGYSNAFKPYKVFGKNIEFVSAFKRETPERSWNEFSSDISWNDVTGTWIYPIRVDSSWAEAEISWDSLSTVHFQNPDIYEYNTNSRIISLNRDEEIITLSGDLTGNLSNLITLNVGDYLYFGRDNSDIIVDNAIIPVDGTNSILQGYIGLTAYGATVTIIAGSTSVDTSPCDISTFLNVGDEVYINGVWNMVTSVGGTTFSVSETVDSSVNSKILKYTSNQVVCSYSNGPFTMNPYSRVIISDTCYFENIDPLTNFYIYSDGLTCDDSSFTILGDDDVNKKLIIQNSSLGENKILHASWGFLSGNFSIEIVGISLTGDNTQFRLNDVNKYLYNIDSNFTMRLAEYDVIYANQHIGFNSLSIGNIETSWEKNQSLSWFGAEFHAGANCGFVIPFVAPGGIITIDENDSFIFSGNSSIENTRAGLEFAAEELIESNNESIQRFTYSVMPTNDLVITDGAGATLTVFNDFAPGATYINLVSPPYGKELKIPAQLTAHMGSSGDNVSYVSIDNPGYGYDSLPTVTVELPGCTGGSVAIITVTTLGLGGEITGATVTFGGYGYSGATGTLVPNLTVDNPRGWELYDNYIWTGYEWIKIERIVSNNLYLETSLTYPVFGGITIPLLPYDCHKQQFLNSTIMQQFYWFIQAKAKDPSSSMLSYINFANGVGGEWALYPERSYTYPLGNSLLQLGQGHDLSQNHLYQKWVYEEMDYPPPITYSIYASDLLSEQSRAEFSTITQEPFSYIDSVISPYQQTIPVCTLVTFHYDNCKMPGKKNPIWVITDEDNNDVQVMSDSPKLAWNFTKTGTFSVGLQISDSNGNTAFFKKESFIIVK